MPNWCTNHVFISLKKTIHSIDYIKKLMSSFNKACLNMFLVETNSSREDNIDKWGTKWDIDPIDAAECFDIDTDSDMINCSLSYHTAWGPNVPATNALYKKIKEFDKDAKMEHIYEEEGMAFYGKSNGETDDSYEIGIAFDIREENCDRLDVISKENNILTFNNVEGFFLIREVIKKEVNFFEEEFKISEYSCFSETYGECSIYECDRGNFYISPYRSFSKHTEVFEQ